MRKNPIKIKNISKLKRPLSSSLPEDVADKWVNNISDTQQSLITKDITNESEIRFTVVIPTYLHRRIKKYCANNAISMKEKLTQIFKDNFPES